jgi:hypothetical protein
MRIVTKRGAGSDGRGWYRSTSNTIANGEGVWSWPPWAGAKSCETFGKATVTNKVMDTGESAQ